MVPIKTLYEFSHRVVIITGAAGGIGLAIAKSFAELGAKLVLIDKSERLEEVVTNNFIKNDFEPVIHQADLTTAKTIESIVSDTVKKYGRIDILINVAGVNVRKKINEYSQSDIDLIFDVNVKSVFNMSNAVASIMKKYLYGKIINISSIQAVTCWSGNGKFSLAPYCASKSAVIALTKAFALDLAQYQINVNAICPAFVDTELVKAVKEDLELYQDIIRRTPLRRFAELKEIVGPVLFLASDESSFITGHSLLVDGGWTIE